MANFNCGTEKLAWHLVGATSWRNWACQQYDGPTMDRWGGNGRLQHRDAVSDVWRLRSPLHPALKVGSWIEHAACSAFAQQWPSSSLLLRQV